MDGWMEGWGMMQSMGLQDGTWDARVWGPMLQQGSLLGEPLDSMGGWLASCSVISMKLSLEHSHQEHHLQRAGQGMATLLRCHQRKAVGGLLGHLHPGNPGPFYNWSDATEVSRQKGSKVLCQPCLRRCMVSRPWWLTSRATTMCFEAVLRRRVVLREHLSLRMQGVLMK